MAITKNKAYAISIVLILLIALNWYTLKNITLGLVVTLLLLMWFGFLAGTVVGKNQEARWKMWWGIFLYLSIIVLAGAIVYFFFHLSFPILFFIMTCVSLSLVALQRGNTITIPKGYKNHRQFQYKTVSLLLVYAVLAIVLFSTLVTRFTVDAVRGPWELVGEKYLIAYALATFIWLLLLKSTKSFAIQTASSILHTFLTSAVALILFPLGFGFDSFMHRAAEQEILSSGFILPKTVYYLGQYAFVLFFHYITLVPIETIDKFLTPVFLSIFIPPLFILTYRTIKKESAVNAALLIPVFLTLPVTSFIQTTPQGLANVFFLVTLAWYLIYANRKSKITLLVLFILASTTMSIHPIAGIPLFLWFFLLFIFIQLKKRASSNSVQRLLWIGSAFTLSMVIPFIFYLSDRFGGALKTSIHLPSIYDFSFTNLFFIESLFYTKQFNHLFDLIYLYRFNWVVVFLIIALTGIIITRKSDHIRGIALFSAGFAIVFLSSVILRLFLSFDNLITYEQTNFSQRLFLLALYFLLPYYVIIIIKLESKARISRYSQILFTVVLTGMITSSMYVSYPRYDQYELVRSYSTSSYDIETVRTIEKYETDASYVVLANQSVSAAAIQELGFKNYYQGYFFYPVPTGGDLYQIYLSMVYDSPSKVNAFKAYELTGINTVYFILNDYWFNAEKIKKSALHEADSSEEIADGKTTIFKYQF